MVAVQADENSVGRAAGIMRQHGAVDIHKRAENWQEGGWSSPAAGADGYASGELEETRDRYPHHVASSDHSHDYDSSRTTVDDYTEGVQKATDRVGDRIGITDSADESWKTRPSTDVSDFTVYESDFQRDFHSRFVDGGYTYEEYKPAYRYGYDLAADNRYRNDD
ncbi:MAG TPA: hypothetical protein VGX03_38230 [Candidatus Binatia bacterium]|nr:hypothetical protein [Candidatus Binatia bacterium]